MRINIVLRIGTKQYEHLYNFIEKTCLVVPSDDLIINLCVSLIEQLLIECNYKNTPVKSKVLILFSLIYKKSIGDNTDL